MPRYAVAGIVLETDLPFTWPLVPADGEPHLRVEIVDTAPVGVDWAMIPPDHVVGDEQAPELTFRSLESFDVVDIPRVATHYLWADRIVTHLREPAYTYLLEIQLLGIVLALWLERRGVRAMHAASLVIDDKAIAFLGRKGGGKTTVAIALLGAGHRLLADDLLALHWEDGDLLANPGYPMLRLWPEQADYFLGDHVGLPLVHPAFTKRRVHLAADQFHSAPAPLRRIYVPQRVTEGPVRLVPLRGRDALGVLLQSPFLGEPTHHLGLAADRFTSLARVARDIGVRSVQIPPGYERLSELVHVIEADLASVS